MYCCDKAMNARGHRWHYILPSLAEILTAEVLSSESTKFVEILSSKLEKNSLNQNVNSEWKQICPNLTSVHRNLAY